jgi:hypothetical protein
MTDDVWTITGKKARINAGLTLDPDVYEKAANEARRRGMSLASFLREIITKHFEAEPVRAVTR